MQPEAAVRSELDTESSQSNVNVPSTKEATTARPQSSGKGSTSANGQFPPPKTDKPRPHVCGTCGRSFARLEHLKRHERSHTKEKPFECPECTRCFARRDLLLRHQQKLHATNTTSSRPKSGRRESVSGASVTGGRVRKNSIATGSAAASNNISGATHRPRANTLGHIDLSGLSFLDVNPQYARVNALGLNGNTMGLDGLSGAMNFEYRGMSNNLGNHGLPKLDTNAINNVDLANSLRTAPPYAFGGFDIDQLFSQGNTINPAQLHFGGSMSTTQANFPALEPFTVHPAIDPQAQADDFGWMRNWNMQLVQGIDEQAIDESSPSRMSSGDSPLDDYTESMNNSGVLAMPNNYQWSGQERQARPSISSARFQLGALGNGLPSLDAPAETVSPDNLHDPTPTNDSFLQQMMLQQQHQHQQQTQQMSPGLVQTQSHTPFAPSLSTFSDSPSMSTSSMTGSARQSSVTSLSTESINDATRQALLMNLSQPSPFTHNSRKYSQPTISSPLSPGRSSMQTPTLPGTDDIRRYVNAFIQYAHPHLPFLHISTLSFDVSDFTSGLRGSSPQNNLTGNGITGANGGAGCLILGMAAIGALYEYDHPASKELFDASKRLLTRYLEERRKVDMSAAVNNVNSPSESAVYTPLWLVQAMLLSVVYGHQCGDKTAADIASTHFAALISLARAAELAQSSTSFSPGVETGSIDMRESSVAPGDSISRHHSAEVDLQNQWLNWKVAEERKRTLFAIFIISSLLTTAYNHTPTIMNSEILLDLPCDEELWSAETAQEWQSRGGLAAAEQNAVSFAGALSSLLTANQRQGQYSSTAPYNSSNPLGALQEGDGFADNELRPSTFGCLVLINALHNYIWETRSRHHGSEWTPQETQSMFSHIEPALNAWQAAWRANEHHKLERPNPFGTGPLSADCVPLLDLAFVRLFVNLGQSKEAFWHRDFDAMADVLARGSEIVQHADTPANLLGNANGTNGDVSAHQRLSRSSPSEQSSSRRERHLRKAAFYAADSLTIACNWNLTYADMSAHELPVQSAMCFFDCSQVLAEWACTVQERVGSYLGVLGRDAVDFAQVPAIMMLETEDAELLRKIDQICESLEAKRLQQENLLALDLQTLNPSKSGLVNAVQSNGNLSACGYGSKILRVTAMMLEKAVVWPVTHVMAKALETQASHMDQRAETSTVQ